MILKAAVLGLLLTLSCTALAKINSEMIQKLIQEAMAADPNFGRIGCCGDLYTQRRKDHGLPSVPGVLMQSKNQMFVITQTLYSPDRNWIALFMQAPYSRLHSRHGAMKIVFGRIEAATVKFHPELELNSSEDLRIKPKGANAYFDILSGVDFTDSNHVEVQVMRRYTDSGRHDLHSFVLNLSNAQRSVGEWRPYTQQKALFAPPVSAAAALLDEKFVAAQCNSGKCGANTKKIVTQLPQTPVEFYNRESEVMPQNRTHNGYPIVSEISVPDYQLVRLDANFLGLLNTIEDGGEDQIRYIIPAGEGETVNVKHVGASLVIEIPERHEKYVYRRKDMQFLPGPSCSRYLNPDLAADAQ